ncbi:MAG: hypothetical protein Q9162_000619 [Coniocarpon cinnabarinum]
MGRTLGAGTYGIVREADSNVGKVAVKIILKKNVKGNEQMVYDELAMLRQLHHQHIVAFHDWFESKVRIREPWAKVSTDTFRQDKFYIVTQLALGGELFDRICEKGRFTERDAAVTIRQVFDAVNYLHQQNIVHRDLKPENLLYLTKDPDSALVLADFGIAKMLDQKDEVLTTMAGSFGYAAPEIMQRHGHGKPVDMWSMGVITYTLLCGYSPFRSESMADLIQECSSGRVVFHERYWRDVSKDAKEFIRALLQPDPSRRLTSQQALSHSWLTGQTASDVDIVKTLRSRRIRTRMRLAIERVQLRNRIENIRRQQSLEEQDDGEDADIPTDSEHAADEALQTPDGAAKTKPGHMSRAQQADILRSVVLAKAREEREMAENQKLEEVASKTGTLPKA